MSWGNITAEQREPVLCGHLSCSCHSAADLLLALDVLSWQWHPIPGILSGCNSPTHQGLCFFKQETCLSPDVEKDGGAVIQVRDPWYRHIRRPRFQSLGFHSPTWSFKCNFKSPTVTVIWVLIGWRLQCLEEKAFLIQLLPVLTPVLCLA